MQAWYFSAILVLICIVILYGISRIIMRNDIMDIFWGPGFALLAIFNFLYSPIQTTWKLILLILIVLWALRLSLHIYVKNKGKEEDFRYQAWRKEWGKTEWWRSFLQIYLLQGVFMYIVALPIIDVMSIDSSEICYSLPAFAYIFPAACAGLGLVIEAVADYQKSVFKKSNPSGLMKQGLWKYSRHPNYFGDALFWWGVGFFSIFIGTWIFGLISALTMNILLRYVSGVPMLEKAKVGNEAYEEYKEKTPVFIPFLKP